MREGAVLSVLMSPQVPERAIEKSLGGLREEVVLLPCHLVDVEHDELGDLGTVSLRFYIDGMGRIGSQRVHRVIEVQDAELRLHREPMLVLQQLVIDVL